MLRDRIKLDVQKARFTERKEDGVKGNFIGGEWVPAGRGETFERRNPARLDDVVGEFPASEQTTYARPSPVLRSAITSGPKPLRKRRPEVLERAAAWLEITRRRDGA